MKKSKEFPIKVGIVIACVLASIVTSCLLAFSKPILNPIKATIVFPEENVATAVWWRDHEFPPSDDVSLWSGSLATYYPDEETQKAAAGKGYDILKPIEEYDNIVTVDNPTADQVIVRETYPITENGETVMYEIIVFGNGSAINRPVTE